MAAALHRASSLFTLLSLWVLVAVTVIASAELPWHDEIESDPLQSVHAMIVRVSTNNINFFHDRELLEASIVKYNELASARGWLDPVTRQPRAGVTVSESDLASLADIVASVQNAFGGPFEDLVFIGPSSLGEGTGIGAFAKVDIPRFTRVAQYPGYSPFEIEGVGVYTCHGLGDGRDYNPADKHSRLWLEFQTTNAPRIQEPSVGPVNVGWYKQHEGPPEMWTTRDVAAGQELFVGYGSGYDEARDYVLSPDAACLQVDEEIARWRRESTSFGNAEVDEVSNVFIRLSHLGYPHNSVTVGELDRIFEHYAESRDWLRTEITTTTRSPTVVTEADREFLAYILREVQRAFGGLPSSFLYKDKSQIASAYNGMGVFTRFPLPAGSYLGTYHGYTSYTVGEETPIYDMRAESGVVYNPADEKNNIWPEFARVHVISAANGGCLANAAWVTVKGEPPYVHTSRPIAAGEEILVTYGVVECGTGDGSGSKSGGGGAGEASLKEEL